jgi:hypothetical protein
LAAAAAPPCDFKVVKVPRTRLRKLIIPAYEWHEAEWEGVEIWRFKVPAAIGRTAATHHETQHEQR